MKLVAEVFSSTSLEFWLPIYFFNENITFATWKGGLKEKDWHYWLRGQNSKIKIFKCSFIKLSSGLSQVKSTRGLHLERKALEYVSFSLFLRESVVEDGHSRSLVIFLPSLINSSIWLSNAVLSNRVTYGHEWILNP